MKETISPSVIAEWTREKVEDELASRAARWSAIMGEYLTLLGELDRRGELGPGFLSIPHFLNFRAGIESRTGQEHLRAARALRDFPKTLAALCAGKISYSKARAITRSKRPNLEDKLVDLARHTTASQLERVVRGVRRVDAAEENDRAKAMEEKRSFGWSVDEDDGMLVFRGRLRPEEGAVLKKAMDEACRETFRGTREPEPLKKHVDVFMHLIERSLRRIDAEPRTADERTMIMVHVAAPERSAERTAELDGGPAIAPETARRLACDASVVEVTHGEDGAVEAGRRSRVFAPTVRRALHVRDDGTCRFPGCEHRIVDAHHIKHWMDGGPTVVLNGTLLCRGHHVAVHEGGFRVEMVNGEPKFFGPDGREVVPPPLPRLPDEEPALDVDAWTLAVRDHERLHLGEVVEAVMSG